jgi:hypothetical protein
VHPEPAGAPLARVAPQIDLGDRAGVHRRALVHDLHPQLVAAHVEPQLDAPVARAAVRVLDDVRRRLVHRERQLVGLRAVEAGDLRHPARHVTDRGEELRAAGDAEDERGATHPHAEGLPVSPPSRKLRIASISEGKIR